MVRRLIAILFAALTAASVAGARSNFNGNVCQLASAKQITAIPGVSTKCANAKPTKGPGSTITTGNWAGKTPTSPQLQVTVASYTDTGALKLAKSNLKQGLPGGTPKKLTGIGSAAYEATAASSTGIHFAVGRYVVYLNLTSIGRPPRATAPLEALAKTIAGRL